MPPTAAIRAGVKTGSFGVRVVKRLRLAAPPLYPSITRLPETGDRRLLTPIKGPRGGEAAGHGAEAPSIDASRMPKRCYSMPSGPWASPGEELPHELVRRVEELRRGARLDDPALPEDRDVVGHAARAHDVVRDDDVGAAVLLVDLLDELAQERGADRVEARVRLVEEDDLRARAPARGRSRRACACRPRARSASCRRRPRGRPRGGGASTISWISSSPLSVCWRSGNATLSNRFIEPNSAPSWNRTPNFLRISNSSSSCMFGTDSPWTRTSPSSG